MRLLLDTHALLWSFIRGGERGTPFT